MNILLTGATGFLGSHLAKKLVHKKHKVICLKRKTSNTFRLKGFLSELELYNLEEIDLNKLFQTKQIEAVIHTATNYGKKDKSILDTIDANLILPLDLMLAAVDNNCQLFINTDTILDKRINHYTLSKKQFLDWFKLFSNEIICINIELEHFYGPFDNKDKFCSYIIHQLLEKVEKIDLTEGLQTRDFIYIDDVISSFIAIINNYTLFDLTFNNFQVGSNQPIQIKKFVKLAKNFSDNKITKLNFGVLPYRKNELMKSIADISELKKLGWEPKISLEDGLKLTIELEKKNLLLEK